MSVNHKEIMAYLSRAMTKADAAQYVLNNIDQVEKSLKEKGFSFEDFGLNRSGILNEAQLNEGKAREILLAADIKLAEEKAEGSTRQELLNKIEQEVQSALKNLTSKEKKDPAQLTLLLKDICLKYVKELGNEEELAQVIKKAIK